MNLSKNATLIRRILVIFSFIIVTAILYNTYQFFQKFKQEERVKMEIIAEALKAAGSSSLNSNDLNLVLKVINSNKTIPTIITNKKGKITGYNNLDTIKALDSLYLVKQLRIMKSTNKPIQLSYMIKKEKMVQNVYYKDSELLTKLKYYPLALLLILVLFGAVIFFAYKSTKVAEQNKLWAGMAKETAHQIGTPLSSLLGWLEILKLENTDPNILTEIEKDITRLTTITDRFSKIGSVPNLEKINIVSEIKKSCDYLKSRTSKQVSFNFETVKDVLFIQANTQLLSWVFENIIKNAIDAMQGKGKLQVKIIADTSFVTVLISDTGKGLTKNQFKKIFETGYTTKKRGWGLGLSLAKRIVEDYHNGKIYVKESVIDKGTTIAVSFKIVMAE